MDSNKNINAERMLFCGQAGNSLHSLISTCFRFKSTLNEWPQFRGGKAIFTHQGKIAIALACSLWDIKEGDHIIAPAYNCGSEIDPLLNSGASVSFYQVNSKAEIVFDDILRKATIKTKLIYIIHYFGWPQEIEGIISWAADRNIRVIEDCALALFSGNEKNPIGLQGDAAIYSFPKSLPVPDGGALVIRNSEYSHDVSEAPPLIDVFRKTLPLFKRNFLRKIDCTWYFPLIFSILQKNKKTAWEVNNKISTQLPESYYFVKSKKKWKQSKLTQGLLNKVNPQYVIHKRRENYRSLLRLFEELPAIQPLFPTLPDCVCPLAFPILTENRDEWCYKLNNCGIMAIPWWAGCHPSVDLNAFPEARYLKNNLVTLPIHQDMDLKHIEYIVNCMKKLNNCHD